MQSLHENDATFIRQINCFPKDTTAKSIGICKLIYVWPSLIYNSEIISEGKIKVEKRFLSLIAIITHNIYPNPVLLGMRSVEQHWSSS